MPVASCLVNSASSAGRETKESNILRAIQGGVVANMGSGAAKGGGEGNTAHLRVLYIYDAYVLNMHVVYIWQHRSLLQELFNAVARRGAIFTSKYTGNNSVGGRTRTPWGSL